MQAVQRKCSRPLASVQGYQREAHVFLIRVRPACRDVGIPLASVHRCQWDARIPHACIYSPLLHAPSVDGGLASQANLYAVTPEKLRPAISVRIWLPMEDSCTSHSYLMAANDDVCVLSACMACMHIRSPYWWYSATRKMRPAVSAHRWLPTRAVPV